MSAATRWAERWEGRGFSRYCMAPVATVHAAPPEPEQLPLQRQPAATGDDRPPICGIQPIAMRLRTLCDLPGWRREKPGQPRG